MKRNFAGIILAAGKGKRMKAKSVNKVVFLLGNKPMVLYAVHLLESNHINPIIVVVGHAKESVMKLLGESVLYAEQKKRLGTGHAARTAVKLLPDSVTDAIIFNGDDAAFYRPEMITRLMQEHVISNAAMTMLTVTVKNPTGLGRIIRDENGNAVAIVEEKDASDEQKLVYEINPGCYIANVSFLKKYLQKIKKSPITGEYYLVSLVELAVANNLKVHAVHAGEISWRGSNTQE